MIKIEELSIDDLEKIMEVEERAFIPPLQASPETIAKRLKMDHTYLGLYLDNRLIGTLAFRESVFSPDDFQKFPETSEEFANNLNENNPNAIFVYSLGILPEYRGKATIELVNAAINMARERGLDYVVGEGRFPSYNGSNQEKIKQKAELKRTIDDAIKNKSMPPEKELLKDSTLAFYHRFGKVNFWKIILNFTPEDKSSGGHRLIIYKKLK
jgi:GNAT superfamily N-acetyltransferase